MYRLSITEQFEDLRSISDNVTDYLARELFKDTFGAFGDYTVNDILHECYSIILQELTDFGIFFMRDDDELLNDWYTAKNLFYVRKFADTYTLRRLLSNEEDRSKVSSMLESDEGVENLFVNMYEYLAETRKEVFELQVLFDFLPFVCSNDAFAKHVKCIIESLQQTDPTIYVPDVDRAKQYIEKTMLLRKYATHAVEKIITGMSLEGKINKKLVDKLLRDYDTDKIAVDQIKIYSVVDLGEINESMQRYKEVMMQKHHERSPHHIEYWIKIRPIEPTIENCILLVAHHYEPETKGSDFWNAINHMLQQGIEVFSPEQADFIKQAASCIHPNSAAVVEGR